MFSLVYVSAATNPIDQTVLGEILTTSQRRNADAGVTGMLLAWDNNFMQALEGDRERVENTFHRIYEDWRHRMITVLIQQEIAGRRFPNWAMELCSLQQLPGEHQALAAKLCQKSRSRVVIGTERSAAEILLDSFRNSMDRQRVEG